VPGVKRPDFLDRRMPMPNTCSFAKTVGFTALFVVAVYLGRLTVVPGTQMSLVWPAAGVAAVWFMLTKSRLEMASAVVALGIATFALNAATGASVALSVGFVAANLVQVTSFVWLLRKMQPSLWVFSGDKPFSESIDLWKLVIAAFGSSLVGTFVGPTAIWLDGAPWTPLAATVWMTRNATSIILISAVGLRLGYRLRGRKCRSTSSADGQLATRARNYLHLPEVAAALTFSFASYAIVFTLGHGIPVAFVLIGATIWVGIRFGTTFVALHTLAFGTAAVVLTLAHFGPFAIIYPESVRALTAQAFVGTIAIVGLVLAMMREERAALLAEVRRGEAAARERAELLTTILETMNEGLVVLQQDGKILMRNSAAHRLLGYRSATEYASTTDKYGLHYPDGRPLSEDESPYRRVLEGEELSDVDLLINNEVVHGRTININASQLPDRAGGGAIIVFRDVTADRRKQSELQAFAGVVAHDLRNPLTTIQGWTEALADFAADHDSDLAHQVAHGTLKIHKSTARMSTLIDDLLAYTTARDAKLNLQSVQLDSLVNSVVAARTDVAPGERPPEFSVGDLPLANADPVLLRQLFENVIGNSIKYTSAGVVPSISIGARQLDSRWIRVEVCDNGIGIPNGEHEKIFDDFHRAHTSEEYRGHGLGLAICKRIVERHGGTIGAKSRAEGGTCVYFSLPVSVAPAESQKVLSQVH
jgi:PAS domain S-box-containing protein